MYKMEICTPAFVYFFLGVLSIVVLIIKEASSLALLIKIISTGLWTWFLNFLCGNDYTILAWILVALPFIIDLILIIAGFIIIVDTVHKRRHNRYYDDDEDEGFKGKWYGHSI